MATLYRRLFKSPDGQKVLKDISNMCGLSRTSFDADPYKTAYFEGQRSVILRILKSVNITDAELNRLMKQAQDIELAEEEQYE